MTPGPPPPPAAPRDAWLLAGAAASLALALLHVAIIGAGARAYAYFGAGDLAVMALRGSLYPASATALVALVLVVWATYAASAAGCLPELPLLRTGLVLISFAYCLRGLVVVLDIVRLMRGAPYPPRHAVFSAAALAIGLVHAVGTLKFVRRRRGEARGA